MTLRESIAMPGPRPSLLIQPIPEWGLEDWGAGIPTHESGDQPDLQTTDLADLKEMYPYAMSHVYRST